ncbi:hypothetical protein ATE84_0793 [Aquimarina sp. MAR_2010_214]|uniref:oligosaccharide repeat unit polymerase n=1 Tax=Aquimarina sp. MAR_2010_214 TaxID=1250026 RepID=UPI000C70C240|nr:oligosaccharide repeat unit polymerase [Aquimarina sp. MAR_2010_214]PKV48781.1 hypothetical protein ATE84_0793 [Aquimarina sp. MAR_2010_214]
MKYFLDQEKYKNFLLLISLFLLMQLCFSLVFENLGVYIKVKDSLKLTYGINYFKFFISLMIVLTSITILSVTKIKDFGYVVSSLFLIFSVFPSAIHFANIEPFDIRIFVSHILLFITVIVSCKIKISFYNKVFNKRHSILLLLFISVIGTIPFIIYYSPYINLKNLMFKEIYETRAMMGEQIKITYLDYIYSWLNKIIIPCLLVYGIYYKKRLIVFFSVLSIVFLFLCGANKIVFVGLFMMLILYPFTYKVKLTFFLRFLIGIISIALFLSIVFDNHLLMQHSLRRNFMLPSLLDILYFDFFEDNYLLWSEVINGLFIDYPYDRSSALIIGEKYFGIDIWSANNGVISNSFANFGIIGNIINIATIGFYISILNHLNISSKFFGIIFMMIVLFYNSALTTVLVSHGGIILLMLALFFLKNTKSTMDYEEN